MYNKRQVIDFFRGSIPHSSLILADDSIEDYAKHVCLSSRRIYVLPRREFPIQTPKGVIVLDYYRCECCGQVILNKNFS